MHKYFFLLVAIIASASCQRNELVHKRTLLPFDQVAIFDLSKSKVGIYQANRLKLTIDGLFIVDKADQRINLIDLSKDSVVTIFGSGIGKGPGEQEFIFEFDVSDSFVTTIDPNLLRISYYNKHTGVLEKTSPTKKNATMWFKDLGSKYLISANVSDSLFYLYDSESDSILSSASILQLKAADEYGLSLPGRYIVNRNTFLYFPVWDYRVFEFLVDGDKLSRGRILYTPLDTFTFKPSIDMSNTTGTIMQAPKSQYNRTGVTETSGFIFNTVYLSGLHPTQRYELFLDVYDTDLNYRFSYGDLYEHFYPNVIQDIAAYGDTICFLLAGDGNVLCYKLNLPESY